MDPHFRLRSRLASMAVLIIGVLLSGLFFFLHWVLGSTYAWGAWLMPLSFASLLGCALIAFLIQLGTRYTLPRGRLIGFLLVIGWVALSLLTTTLETLRLLSHSTVRGIAYAIVLGGLPLGVIPGFLLMLLPWPPRFLLPRQPPPEDA